MTFVILKLCILFLTLTILFISKYTYTNNCTRSFVASLSPGVDIYSLGDDAATTNSIKTGETGVRTFALTKDDSHIGVVDLHGKRYKNIILNCLSR